MKYFIKIFGCQMNKSDGERIATIAEKYQLTQAISEEKSDIIFVVTCSVRASAIRNLKRFINRYYSRKKIVLTGCMLSTDISYIEDKARFVSIDKIESEIAQLITKNDKSISRDYLRIAPKITSQAHAYIPIMTGCNNFCSYCVVPFTRGRERSRPVKDIIKEINIYNKAGYKAITLLGQNVNSYKGKDQIGHEINFSELLQKVANNFSGIIWFVTSHPKDMSDDLIEVISRYNNIANYVHLPIQSGNDKILEKMNRKYNSVEYLNLVHKIKNRIPGVALSTDIIVGFPGETDKQFDDTATIMEKVGFDMAYIARYSPRPETAASKLIDEVSPEEKANREKRLTKILKETAKKNKEKWIGRTVDVLIEREYKDYYLGKMPEFFTVKISEKVKIGDIVRCKLLQANDFGFIGKINE